MNALTPYLCVVFVSRLCGRLMIFTASPGQCLARFKHARHAVSRMTHLSLVTWMHSAPHMPAYFLRYLRGGMGALAKRWE